MARTALDASVIIAGLVTWHEFHDRARAALDSVLAGDETVILPVHSLLEAYSVLTRLPPPRRLTADKARTLLSESLEEATVLAGLEEGAWSLLEDLADRSIVGGMTYDAAIVASSRKAGVSRILTLNGRHFELVAGEDIDIWEPEKPAPEEGDEAEKQQEKGDAED